MAGDGVLVKIGGLPELKAALLAVPRNLRRRALRDALAVGARIIRDEARRRAPVLRFTTYSGASVIRRGVRAPGTLRKAISVRTSKVARRGGDVGVFVNVRPAKGADRGTYSPRDPYYWRWQEFGTIKKPGAGYLQAAGQRLGDALRAFTARIGPAIGKFNTTKP